MTMLLTLVFHRTWPPLWVLNTAYILDVLIAGTILWSWSPVE